jgi:acetyl-CoA acetyltransferase
VTDTRVEIAGVGIHPFGRFEDRSVTDLGVTAVQGALTEAGVGRGDFQAAFCGTAYAGVAAGHKVLGALALTGIPIVDIEAGCASGGAALQLAAGAIRAGQYDCVLVFGMEKMPKGIIRSSFFEPWREEAGLAATPAYFALRAQRVMRESGITKDDLARLVVKNRRNGVHNPNAMFRKEVTVDEVLGSRLVCDPLHLFMLCSPNEGAAAVVLKKAEGSGSGRVLLSAAVLRSHLPGSVLGEATPLAGIDDTTITPPSTLAAQDAYAAAGVGPDDVDLVECQDTDAARELLAWEELGLCGRGEQRGILDSGAADLGGRRPVNASGGLLSKGEPLGASGLGQVVELVHQLRGEAGVRQVEGARVGLAHTVGRGANASVTILQRT